MTTPNDDAMLMSRVRDGDRASFESLVRQHANALLTFLNRTCGDYHRSEELFQEVFLSVWKSRETYRFPAPVKPWLYKIAVNISRASWKKAKIPMEHIPDMQAIPERNHKDLGNRESDKEIFSIASEAVQMLPEQQKVVVALRIWNEMSYREIAQAMRISEETVRSHMHHALKALRQQLAPRMSSQ